MTDLDHAAALDALETGYRNVTDVVTGLSEADLMRPSGCAGWAVTDVLYHQLLDAQRALVAFATPVTGPADRDDVSYWVAFAPQDGEAGDRARAEAAAHARFVRVAASAYPPAALARVWSETAAAACRAARACRAEAVTTQGYVLCPADFTATLAVETAVHYLDLTVGLPSAPPPDPASLVLVRRVLEGLLGSPLPASWDDVRAAVKGTGRAPLTDEDRALLGPLAERVPLFT
ncbi:MAG TPA: maleylpyruvate isomerase N-terminal domain-containing protein [Streptosporangiaceae bacterium]|nr:maleylpyruvate isomerase N-terminal domain-containing protein [Streptosporangiaceae bacterium]